MRKDLHTQNIDAMSAGSPEKCRCRCQNVVSVTNKLSATASQAFRERIVHSAGVFCALMCD